MKDTVLLTGITGNLGSWLAVELLRQGKRVLALMRDKDSSVAACRLNWVLDIAGGTEFKDNIEIIYGDICKERLGLASDMENLNRVSKIVHCAACTKFLEDDDKSHQAMNVLGTLNVLELTARLSIPLVHVSSAYIAGKREGVVKESEIDVGQSFNNVYENTKCRSEMLVHNWAALHPNPVVVLRPSIVMGDSQYGRTVHFSSLYDYMRALALVAPHLGSTTIRVVTAPDVTKNIIPVDYFAKASSYIIDSGVTGTFHITNPFPMTMKDFGDIFSRLFGPSNYKMVKPDSFSSRGPSEIESLLQKAASIYYPYMLSEPVFDRTNTDAVLAGSGIQLPPMDLSYFKKLFDYGVSVNWHRTKPQANKPAHNPSPANTDPCVLKAVS
jgi:thioester reductase-like protein